MPEWAVPGGVCVCLARDLGAVRQDLDSQGGLYGSREVRVQGALRSPGWRTTLPKASYILTLRREECLYNRCGLSR